MAGLQPLEPSLPFLRLCPGWNCLPIINVTIFELISAQGSHTINDSYLVHFIQSRDMCIFYSSREIILLRCQVVFPFTAHEFEGTKKSQFLSCGFFCYFLNTLLGKMHLAPAGVVM